MDELQKLTKNLATTKNKIWDVLLSAGYVSGIILMIIGIIKLSIELMQYYKIYSIKSYPILKKSGTIIASYMETKSFRDSYVEYILLEADAIMLYRTRIAFTYTINGKSYISYSYSYHEPWYENPMIPKHEMDMYKVGDKVDIIINPNDENEAYLVNKSNTYFDPTTISIVVILVGLKIVYSKK